MAETQTPDPSAAGAAVMRVNPEGMDRLVGEHESNSAEVLGWATGDPGYAAEFLRSHGNVNYATYLQVASYWTKKVTVGTGFAAEQAGTAEKLRAHTCTVTTLDEANATRTQGAINA